jgi:chromosome segregation ATPase
VALFDGLRAALNAKAPSVADLEKAVEDARRALQQTTEAASALRDERRSMLSASDERRSAHKRALAEAEDAEEDARLYLEELEGRLTAARAAAAAQERRRRYDEASRLSTIAQRDLAKRYPELAKGFVALLRQLSEARIAIEAANADLPEGQAPIKDPEEVLRDLPALPERVVREKKVWRWQTAEGQILPEGVHLQSRSGNEGTYQVSSIGDIRRVAVRRRKFLEREVAQYQSAVQGPRLAALAIPGLVAGDPDFWKPKHASFGVGPQYILATLDELASGKPLERVQAVLGDLRAVEDSDDEPDGEEAE